MTLSISIWVHLNCSFCAPWYKLHNKLTVSVMRNIVNGTSDCARCILTTSTQKSYDVLMKRRYPQNNLRSARAGPEQRLLHPRAREACRVHYIKVHKEKEKKLVARAVALTEREISSSSSSRATRMKRWHSSCRRGRTGGWWRGGRPAVRKCRRGGFRPPAERVALSYFRLPSGRANLYTRRWPEKLSLPNRRAACRSQ